MAIDLFLEEYIWVYLTDRRLIVRRRKSVSDIVDQKNRIGIEAFSRNQFKRYKRAEDAARRYIGNIERSIGRTLRYDYTFNDRAYTRVSRSTYMGLSNG